MQVRNCGLASERRQAPVLLDAELGFVDTLLLALRTRSIPRFQLGQFRFVRLSKFQSINPRCQFFMPYIVLVLFGFLRVSLVGGCNKVVPEKLFRRRIFRDTPSIRSCSAVHSDPGC